MCFSATSSFVASGVLGTIGGSTLKKARRHERLFAYIPIFFAIQQLCEGFVWVALYQGKVWLVPAYGFLFFAHVFWPTYIPIAMYVLEKRTRKITRWFILLGIITSLAALIGLLSNPLNIHVIGHSIDYGVRMPLQTFVAGLYFIVVFGALIVSHKPFLRLLAVIVFLTALAAQIFFYVTFASVWCFFAAISSILVDVYLRKKHPIS